MRMTAKDRAAPLMKKGSNLNEKSLAFLAEQTGIPLGTLKTRVKRLLEKGVNRERAIQLAIERPIGPQGRPRKH